MQKKKNRAIRLSIVDICFKVVSSPLICPFMSQLVVSASFETDKVGALQWKQKLAYEVLQPRNTNLRREVEKQMRVFCHGKISACLKCQMVA